MHDLYKLKENIVKELENYGKKDLTKSSLDDIDKLAHAAKNIAKVIECCEDEESGYSRRGGYSMRNYYDDGYSSDGNYVRPDGSYRREIVDSSYARGRGRYAKRDSMGRYSSASDEMSQEIRKLINKSGDEQTRLELSRLLDKVEMM